MEFLYTGFYKTLQQSDKYENFGFLENIFLDTTVDPYDFLHGLCYIFATCLNIIFRYDLYGIYDNDGDLIHAYCTKDDPKHGLIFIDIRGCTNDFKTFISEFDDFITITNDEPINIHQIEPKFSESKYSAAAFKLIEQYKEYYNL